MMFYLLTSIACIWILKDTSFFPTWLGGSGSPFTNYYNYFMPQGFPEANTAMKVIYVVEFGKHVGRTFMHMFIRSEGNYYEYTLHHVLSCFLILFSYLTNFWLVGIMVMFCHDWSDLCLQLARAYKVPPFPSLGHQILQ